MPEDVLTTTNLDSFLKELDIHAGEVSHWLLVMLALWISVSRKTTSLNISAGGLTTLPSCCVVSQGTSSGPLQARDTGLDGPLVLFIRALLISWVLTNLLIYIDKTLETSILL